MKSKKISISVGIVVLVLVLIAGGFFIINKKPNTEKVLTDYFTLLNNSDYEGMYEFLTEESKNSISKDEFITRNKNIYSGIEAKDITVEFVEGKFKGESGEVKYVNKMITLAGELSFDNRMSIIRENKELKVKWDSSLIFPELKNNYKVRVNTTKGKRGDILDRNGQAIATDGIALNVGIVPKSLTENKEADIMKLSTILGISVQDVNGKLNASYVKPDMFIPIKIISKNDPKKDEILKIPGVMVKNKDMRVYPLGESAAHLTGYVQTINAEELASLNDESYGSSSLIGKNGLEKIYEKRLRAVNGQEIYIVDENEKRYGTVLNREVKNGENIKTTIDSQKQGFLYSQIKGEKGATVAMDSKTGAVLALVSSPAFDPNEFAMGISNERWKSLTEDKTLPLYNRFVTVNSPGSVFKPITAAIGLEEKILNPDEDKKIEGLNWKKDSSWGDYEVTRVHKYNGDSNLKNALIYSDNIYFAKTAIDIGKEKFIEGLKKMGFGEDFPFEYGVTKSQYAANGEIKSEIQLGDSGYGQGEVLVNPIHLASVYSMFVNNGGMIKPYLEIKSNKTTEFYKENIISKENAEKLLKGMIEVVENPEGTGRGAYIKGRILAGKTGTAEIKKSKEDKEGTEVGWFALMNADNSKEGLMIITMIEDVKNRGGSGFVVPLVKKAFEN